LKPPDWLAFSAEKDTLFQQTCFDIAVIIYQISRFWSRTILIQAIEQQLKREGTNPSLWLKSAVRAYFTSIILLVSMKSPAV